MTRYVVDKIPSHGGLQANVDLLSATFGRPVIGVHNKTYGLPFDIVECLIQRDFAYNTLDVRVTYDYVKACLGDPTVRKVVLVGHSQGGIIISMVIDELLKDLPQRVFGKMVRLQQCFEFRHLQWARFADASAWKNRRSILSARQLRTSIIHSHHLLSASKTTRHPPKVQRV